MSGQAQGWRPHYVTRAEFAEDNSGCAGPSGAVRMFESMVSCILQTRAGGLLREMEFIFSVLITGSFYSAARRAAANERDEGDAPGETWAGKRSPFSRLVSRAVPA